MTLTLSKEHANLIADVIRYSKSSQLSLLIKKLYSDVAFEDLKHFDHKYLYDAAYASFEVLKSKTKKGAKVNYYAPSKDGEFAILEIANDDVPFLVDSLSNELKLREIDINLICHSTFHVLRSKDGAFESFSEQGGREYVIQMHIPNRLNPEEIKSLMKHIDVTLECVNFAVEDWRGMTSKMQEASDGLDSYFAEKKEELKAESIAFLEWLVNNHIVFLGALECTFQKGVIKLKPGSKRGIVKSNYYDVKDLPFESELSNGEYVVIRKWDQRSIVHRTAPIDIILVKKLGNAGECIGAYVFFGLFTSTVYYQSVRHIPLMRQKVRHVIDKYGYPETSHNCKELVTAMESFPRGELLQMTVDDIYNTATGIVSLTLVPRVKVFLRADQANKFISCIIFIPEKKFSTEARIIIEDILCKFLNGTVEKRYIQIGEASLTRLQVILKLSTKEIPEHAETKMEEEIIKALTVWSDDLYSALVLRYSKRLAAEYFARYKSAFDFKYKAAFSGANAIFDIKFLEESISLNKVTFDIYIRTAEQCGDKVHLKIYTPDTELAISSTLPIIENLGLFAEDVQTHKVSVNIGDKKRALYIHNFTLTCKIPNATITDLTCEHMKHALEAMWSNKLDDDHFNSLIIALGVSHREANLMRVCARYLRQTKYPLSQEYTLHVIHEHAAIVKKIIQLFELKFRLSSSKYDDKAAAKIAKSIRDDLNEINGINEDKVVRSLLHVVLAMLRTNFYQRDEHGEFKEYISFKLNSKDILDLPLPRPYAEIFVYSKRFEAIHLRGAKIARGGLRWSDRAEDYRTEVLGLMKAQMTKNSVIVPSGSKGGFFVKSMSMADGRDAYLNEGIECYKLFLSGALDLTDNIIDGKVVPPKDVMRHDHDDPYLVVAADKGTATFSDIANSVSAKYDFWLGDAFASGGSAGYDHKKMAITAKGAWISVVDHFQAMGMDISKEAFTCVGIGDMSGDVFGNGMLLSNQIKLVAAFNHAHIFIDPNPDTALSFKERSRLFTLPRSQWTDYNAKLISSGGGIYSRKDKAIKLSDEALRSIGLAGANTLSPDDIITAILKAPVDLLWNGGIGTYIKSTQESNDKIGDKSNDNVRVNGSEVRAKVVGEGGNLGATQLGRVEYAMSGGRINTDFIDNSAGVDCSDHEVNMKITLSEVVRNGKLKKDARDKLFEAMTSDVAQLVLNDNFKQTQILSIEQQKHAKINAHQWFIRYLESRGELDRAVEYLPSDEEMKSIMKEGVSLTRPELSVLLAYAKNSALYMLSKDAIKEDKFLEKFLIEYFPEPFVKKYQDLIEKHLLKKEILATVLVNEYINMLGCTSFHQMHDETGASAGNILKAFVIVKEVFNIDEYWHAIEKLDTTIPIDMKLSLFDQIQGFVERNIIWILSNIEEIVDIQKAIELYKRDYMELKANLNNILSQDMKSELKAEEALYHEHKQVLPLAVDIYKLRLLKTSMDIIKVFNDSKCTLNHAAQVFNSVGEILHMRWLILQTRKFIPKQYVQVIALRALIFELSQLQIQLTNREIKSNKSNKVSEGLAILESKPHVKKRLDEYIAELKSGDATEAFVSKITIAVKYIKALV